MARGMNASLSNSKSRAYEAGPGDNQMDRTEDRRDSLRQGFGDVMVTWHIRNGKLEWTEKSVMQTEKKS